MSSEYLSLVASLLEEFSAYIPAKCYGALRVMYHFIKQRTHDSVKLDMSRQLYYIEFLFIRLLVLYFYFLNQ